MQSCDASPAWRSPTMHGAHDWTPTLAEHELRFASAVAELSFIESPFPTRLAHEEYLRLPHAERLSALTAAYAHLGAFGWRAEKNSAERSSEFSMATVAKYTDSLRRAVAGEVVPELPNFVVQSLRRSMEVPEPTRAVDWRQPVPEPFEPSFFWSQVKALAHTATTDTTWWAWLGGPGRARRLHDDMVAWLVEQAHGAELSACILLLDLWLIKGERDDFRALSKEFDGFYETATGQTVHIGEIQTREADAYERPFSKDGLLVCLLRSLVAWLRSEGVISVSPPRDPCASCACRVYNPSAPGCVGLVCFLPCGHWLCHECFVRDRTSRMADGRSVCCPLCNVEALPLTRDWHGEMEELSQYALVVLV